MGTGILIISHETPGTLMSGPAIRYWHLAQALAATFEVTLAVPGPVDLAAGRAHVVAYDRETGQTLRGYASGCALVIVAGFVLRHYPFLLNSPQPMVVDLYDPFLLENLAIHSDKPLAEQAAIHRINHSVQIEQLARGDFFLCASEQQRDFWLGMLAAVGRVNPYTFGVDPTLRRLIDIVPFGLPDSPPEADRLALKGVVPGIARGDQVIYWGGGLWDWVDPLTAIRAVALLAPQRPGLRLFFAGIAHPNPMVPPMRQAAEAQRLSAELGLTGRHVFFNQWVPYGERAAYLLDADVALSLHLDTLETRYAYRTRLLDYLWAGLPMVVTRGDVLAERTAALGLAIAVASGDAPAVARALAAYLDESAEERVARQARAQLLAAESRWARVVAPLLAFCNQPSLAADRRSGMTSPTWHIGLATKAWQSLRRRGLAGLWRDIRLYLNR